MFVCVHLLVCAYVCICMCLYVCVCVCECVHVFVCGFICVSACAYACVRLGVCLGRALVLLESGGSGYTNNVGVAGSCIPWS